MLSNNNNNNNNNSKIIKNFIKILDTNSGLDFCL